MITPLKTEEDIQIQEDQENNVYGIITSDKNSRIQVNEIPQSHLTEKDSKSSANFDKFNQYINTRFGNI